MKFMIRFGKKEHLQEIIDGKIRFSPVKNFINLEKEQKEKGRGDYKEGKFEFKSGHGTLTNLLTREILPINGLKNFLISFEPLDKASVFCLSYYDEDSIVDYISAQNYKIKIPTNNYECIKKDFKDADYGLLILEPEKFISNVKNITDHQFFSDKIQYLDDYEILSYVLDLPKSDLEAIPGKKHHICTSNIHRLLFCKDPYFKNQNEYRFLNMDNFIDKPVSYNFKFTSKYMLVPIDKLENTLSVVY